MAFLSPMLIGKVWIYRLLFLFVFLCVCSVTDFSGEDKAIAVSNFARRFVGILGRESPILGNVAPPEAQNSVQAKLTNVRVTFYL